jgi:predicted DNA-binding transcriptional regulator AlpA
MRTLPPLLLGIAEINDLGVPFKSRGWYWKQYTQGKMPAPVKLGGRNAPLRWWHQEIEEWLKQQKPKV